MKNPFDDTLPEEGEPQYEELTTMLQQAYSKSVSVTPDRQAQILARVRERLGQTDQGDSLNGNLLVPQSGMLDSYPHQTVSPAGKPRRDKRRFRLMALLTAAMIVAVLLGSFLLLTQFWTLSTILSHPSRITHTPGVLSLQVTPSTVAVGQILTLRGSNFYPSGRVGLTRDNTDVPIADRGGHSIIHADKTGSFSDTVMVDPSWGSGSHTIHAEDAHSHKSAYTTVTVIGQDSLRPPHLVFSTPSIDLGSDDQTTNSTQMIALINAGGGQITWRATATESWLLISPASGTISSDQSIQVAIAGDRSNLNVGSHAANVIFRSNAGQANLAVKMGVEPLQPGHEAVQLTPPVLTFTGTNGGADPPEQIVTASNPGNFPLQWSASSATSDGSSWLSVSPLSGVVAKGDSQQIAVSVDINSLLPGFYSGWVTFTSQGPHAVQVSQQTIYVSVTIARDYSKQSAG